MMSWLLEQAWVVFASIVITTYIVMTVRTSRDRQRQRALMDNIPDLAWVKDKKGRFLMVNKAFGDIWGVPPQQLIGKTDFDLSSKEHAEQYLLDDLKVMASGKNIRMEIEAPNDQTGKTQWVDLIKTPVRSQGGKIIGTAGLARDVSEKKEAEAKLHWIAWHDSLTKLYNRGFLEQTLHQLCQAHQTFSVILIDLDNFKRINDALGHSAGDDVLKCVAQRLSSLEHQCFRLGGDEFVILIRGEATTELRRKIQHDFATPIIIRKLPFEIGFTAGLAVFPKDATSGQGLMQAADVALYEGKRSGRGNIVTYQEEMSRHAMRQLELEQDLREALRSNQFRLVYQPQVDLISGQLVGFEALIRWHHPQYGEIPPSEFILFAEQTGVVADIGNWVLRAAIQQIKQWYNQDLPILDVAINASVVQFEQPAFVESVIDLLDALPKEARGKLHLELTESVLMNKRARSAISKLAKAGIKVIMDDFGTGYSNLSMLSELALSKIKFDRSLIQDVSHNEAKGRICSALLTLASELDLIVVAEGVETQEDGNWLTEHHCPLAQGYYFSKPLEVRKIDTLLFQTPVRLPIDPEAIASKLH